jgi:hypothetical protein
MSKITSFSIPTADGDLHDKISQAALKNGRSKSWVIVQALKHYFNEDTPAAGDSEPIQPVAEVPEPPAPKEAERDSPLSLDAKNFINFE